MLTQLLFDYWESRISIDIKSFALPGTLVEVVRSGSTISATWERRNGLNQARFSLRDSGIRVQFQSLELTYEQFLAHPEMGDLAFLAKQIQRTLGLSFDYFYLPSRGQFCDGRLPASVAVDLIANSVESYDEPNLSHLLFILGNAGTGKTVTLKKITTEQAKKYEKGATEKLFLYIDAQGRGLTRLSDAISKTFDDLGVSLQHQQVTPLTRAGLIIPIIDGFDELISSSSTDTAYNSLQDFLSDLEGKGQILASARSSYYEREFASKDIYRKNRDLQYTQSLIEILPWDLEEQQQFVMGSLEISPYPQQKKDEIRSQCCDFLTHNSESRIFSKPFFLAKILELISDSGNHLLPDPQTIIRDVSRYYIKREVNQKLLGSTGEKLLSESIFQRFLEEVANELWLLQSNEVDTRTLEELFLLVADEEKIPPDSLSNIIQRLTYLAFLKYTGNKVTFEHEAFFGYFLSDGIGKAFHAYSSNPNNDYQILSLLKQNELPELLPDMVFPILRDERPDPSYWLQIFSSLGESRDIKRVIIQENLGHLAFKIIQNYSPLEMLSMSNLIFKGIDFQTISIAKSKLHNIQFRKCNFSNCNFVDCTGTSIFFDEPYVSSTSTILQITGENINWNHFLVFEQNGITPVFNPIEIDQIAVSIRLKSVSENKQFNTINPAVLKLIDDILRIFDRTTSICLDIRDRDGIQRKMANVIASPYWKPVVDALIQSNLVIVEQKQTSGPQKQFLRKRFDSYSLMDGLKNPGGAELRVKEFWNAIAIID